MAQNRSSAVMQQRAHHAPDSLDYFPTPPWATRALTAHLQAQQQLPLKAMQCWEPACGELHMACPLGEAFDFVRVSDVFRYSDRHELCDFLTTGRTMSPVDWVITNPPFLHAAEFAAVAMDVAKAGVAMLVRSAWLEGAGRYRDLFEHCPPSTVLQFTQRVVMLEGRLIREGAPDPFNLDEAGKPRKASTATSYCWVIWQRAGIDWDHDTRHRWVPPIRTELERPGDYPDYSAQLREIEARAQALQGSAQGGLALQA